MSALADVHRRVDAKLGFTRSPLGETYLSDQFIAYPFHITRPFYLEDDPQGMPTLYLQSVSGGIYAGDEINLDISIKKAAMAQVTTQASSVCHGMQHKTNARQQLTITAGENTYIEYFSDPIILFPHAHLANKTVIDVADDATVVLIDSFIEHDPSASDKRFKTYASELRVTRHTQLLCLDRFSVTGAQFATLQPYTAHGTLVLVTQTPSAEILDVINTTLKKWPQVFAGTCMLPNDCGLWIRVLAPDTHQLRGTMIACWQVIRKAMTGLLPRVRRK